MNRQSRIPPPKPEECCLVFFIIELDVECVIYISVQRVKTNKVFVLVSFGCLLLNKF
jgi:hypothetical protein